MSVTLYASPGYDVIRHHVSPPSAASMDSGLIDYSSPEAMSQGSDRRPSLTPSRVEESLSSETTITLPLLPPSPERMPSLHTTQPSSISFTTPEGNKPSIESEETVYSDYDLDEGGIPPSHITSHDMNWLLQYLHDIDAAREDETRDMSDHLRRIEEELFDLSAFLRTRRPTPPPAQPQYVLYPVEVPAPAPASTPVAVPMPVPIPVPVEVPARQPPPIPPRPVVEHEFEEYVPMSDASADVSLSERVEEPTPIAAPIPPQPASEVSSIDLSESIESMSEPLQTPSQSVREPAASPISLQIPVSPSISSAATPELSPPSSRSSSSAALAGLTPSPSVQPEVLPDVRPLSPPSDLGQVGRRRSPVSESWYTRPRPPPAAEEATEVEWRPEPGTTIVPLSHVIGTGATGVSGLLDYNELLDLVRGGAGSQEVVAEQQREIIRYLGGLNTWLERDVIDRQFECRQLSERMDQLRDDLLHRLGRPPTPLMYRPPYGPQIVGKVPAGGVVIPPIPDRGVSRQSGRSQIVVPPALSDSNIPYPVHSTSEESITSSETERSFQIPPVYG
ncbi:hypothetical protein FS749_010972 [Ceratobasidium sp. UAMH 11750]|nr:hypothetical protein FS749_010972 [Ceratobasidium sp. UAMH 11750]